MSTGIMKTKNTHLVNIKSCMHATNYKYMCTCFEVYTNYAYVSLLYFRVQQYIPGIVRRYECVYAHTTTYVPVRMCLLHVCFPSIVGKSTRLNESMIFLSGGESSGPNARSKNKGCYEREKGREKEK